jgi:hypothetical protein
MGALTGNAIKDTYLDVVQLGKSGAGLPSHAGKEAALYDGSGAQILGRTAVRHWLDPDPDAISASSWEFSSLGDKTQVQLEALGWAFSNCTAVVSGGAMVITSAGSNNARAYLTVSLNGDFDYVTTIFGYPTSPAAQYDYTAGLMVGIPAPTDAGHNILISNAGGEWIGGYYATDTFDDSGWGAGGTANNTDLFDTGALRICRYSGTVYVVSCNSYLRTWNVGVTCRATFDAGWTGGSAASASTFTRLTYLFDATTNGQKFMIPFLRRFL